MQYIVNLTANVRRRIEVAGRFFLLEDTGAAASIEVKIDMPGESDEIFSVAEKGLKVRLMSGRFRAVELLSTVPAQVLIVISNNDIDVNLFENANVNATIASPLPVPVSNDRGSPGNLMHVTGVSINDAPAVAISSNAPVAVNDTVDLIAAADANRRAIRFCNLGPDPVALGPAGLTWAQRVIVLEVGDVWVEDRAANLAWSGITDAAKSASVTWQGITA